MNKMRSRILAASTGLMLAFLLAVQAQGATAETPFSVYGYVFSPGIVLYYNSLGTPAAESFQIYDPFYVQIQTWICRRPYLGACAPFMDMNSTGHYAWVSGVFLPYAGAIELQARQSIIDSMVMPMPLIGVQ